MAGVENWQTETRKKLMNIMKKVAINATEYQKSRIKQFTLQWVTFHFTVHLKLQLSRDKVCVFSEIPSRSMKKCPIYKYSA